MKKPAWDTLWLNANLATCEQNYGIIEHAAMAVKQGQIAWLGTMQALPAHSATETYDLNGAWITPGLIDCHTHVVYADNRANEFELRLQGVSYEEIAKQGGGIQATVSATRQASEATLLQQSLKRVRAMLAQGTTTLEIKSGYGLDLETELKMLRVAKQIETLLPVTIHKTFLGAHTIPKEYKGQGNDYVDFICHKMIPHIAQEQLADAVDVFCERIAFNLKQTDQIFQTAKAHKLAVKCHGEQLSDSGCAVLAAKHQALSIDHLEYASLEGVKAIAKSGTVAVLLPGAFYFLREKQVPPVEWLRQHRVPMAVATDCNPGTSPMVSLLLAMNMACTLFRLTPEEAMLGVTYYAARALGLGARRGSLVVGKVADFAVWDINHPAELAYYMGANPLVQLIVGGSVVE